MLRYLYGKCLARKYFRAKPFPVQIPQNFSNLLILHTYLPMKMEQSVPKRRHIKFRRRGITQKIAHNTIYEASHGIPSSSILLFLSMLGPNTPKHLPLNTIAVFSSSNLRNNFLHSYKCRVRLQFCAQPRISAFSDGWPEGKISGF